MKGVVRAVFFGVDLFWMSLYRALRGYSCGSRGFLRGPDDGHKEGACVWLGSEPSQITGKNPQGKRGVGDVDIALTGVSISEGTAIGGPHIVAGLGVHVSEEAMRREQIGWPKTRTKKPQNPRPKNKTKTQSFA